MEKEGIRQAMLVACTLAQDVSRVFTLALNLATEERFEDLQEILIRLDETEKRLRELKAKLQELEK